MVYKLNNNTNIDPHPPNDEGNDFMLHVLKSLRKKISSKMNEKVDVMEVRIVGDLGALLVESTFVVDMFSCVIEEILYFSFGTQ